MNDLSDLSEELRCFCARKPLLARYGLRDGKPLVHIRIYKQARVFGEMILTSGTLKLKCRDCYRWHTVSIKKGHVSLASVAG